MRVPDLVVTKVGAADPRLVASDVLLAVEIISPDSRNVDLHLKPFEYAEAQIPYYWIVDLDPPVPSITVFHLGASGEGYLEEPVSSSRPCRSTCARHPRAGRPSFQARVTSGLLAEDVGQGGYSPVAVFTRSESLAERLPVVDDAIGLAARIAVDHLRLGVAVG